MNPMKPYKTNAIYVLPLFPSTLFSSTPVDAMKINKISILSTFCLFVNTSFVCDLLLIIYHTHALSIIINPLETQLHLIFSALFFVASFEFPDACTILLLSSFLL